MDFKYFDVQQIFADVEKNDQFDMGDIILSYEDTGFSHRWIQPPVACYLVNTMDQYGNVNSAPISMGTAMWGEPADCGWYFCFNVHNRRNTRKNLLLHKECVVSFYPAKLMQETLVATMPLPPGINEIEVAKLTPFPSRQVAPPSIEECVSNLEVKILDSYPLSNNTLFIGKVVGCSVQADMVEKDIAMPDQPGLGRADLLYEVSINGTPSRLNHMRMNPGSTLRHSEKLGDDKRWIGNFYTWMDSEEKRGRITAAEKAELLALEKTWVADRDPKRNGDTKRRLTDKLTEICWRNI